MIENYELMLITKSSLSVTQEKNIFPQIEEFLAKDSKIIEKKDFGKRKFAYPVKKEEEGNYYLFHLAINPQEIRGLNLKLKTTEDILRFLILRIKERKRKVKKSK